MHNDSRRGVSFCQGHSALSENPLTQEAGLSPASFLEKDRTRLTMFQRMVSGKRSPSPIIFPLPLVMMKKISPSVLPASDVGSFQSCMVSFMDSTMSPLPSPFGPWHIAQS